MVLVSVMYEINYLLARKDISAHNISLKSSAPPLLHVKAIVHISVAVNI